MVNQRNRRIQFTTAELNTILEMIRMTEGMSMSSAMSRSKNRIQWKIEGAL
jgi:hypothetical protein